MKLKSLTLVLCVNMLIATGCHFSVGTKKDLKTGLSLSYNGFGMDDAFLVNGAAKRLTSNKVHLDSTFSIVAIGVENYTLKDGKAYPGCEITVKDKSGKVIGSIPDAMSNTAKNGLDPKGATTLSASITLHAPFTAGETYHVTTRFFDKQNEKNKIVADVDINVQ